MWGALYFNRVDKKHFEIGENVDGEEADDHKAFESGWAAGEDK